MKFIMPPCPPIASLSSFGHDWPMPQIEAIQGDITKLQVDAIVNAANRTLLGGGGVDGAIHRAAGPELKAYCAKLGGCEVGEAKITPGFRLPAKWIIHTVGPVWRGGDHGEDELLASCYRKSLELALEHGVRSIAFPAISTGAYRFPKARAARIAVDTCRAFQAEHGAPERIILCAFDEETYRLYEQLLRKRT